MNTSYKILGADGQEYGPVESDEIKQWIKEKRLERKTPVFATGAKDWAFLESVPELVALFERIVPPVLAPAAAPAPPKSGGGLNVIIPYKNARALMAYYFGVFSVIPVLGIPLGLTAFILGILGLRFRRKHPGAGGVVHAWIGILVGGFFGLAYLVLIVLALYGKIGQS